MKTNRRDFIGLIGAALGALTLPRTPAAPIAPPVAKVDLPQPPAAPKASTDAVTCKLWKPKSDVYEVPDRNGNPVTIAEYNFREEYEGPMELLNFGGTFGDVIVVNSKTIENINGMMRTTVKATRYPKIL